MTIGAAASQDLDKKREEHGVVEGEFQFDVSQVTGAVLSHGR